MSDEGYDWEKFSWIVKAFKKAKRKKKREKRVKKKPEKKLTEMDLALRAEEIRKKIEAYKRVEKPVMMPCSACGEEFLVDVKHVGHLAEMLGGIDPDSMLICPECRKDKKYKRKIKAETRKRGGLKV